MWLEAEKGPVGREGEAVGSREELGSGRALGMAERRGPHKAPFSTQRPRPSSLHTRVTGTCSL